jgi:hypothetical protein
MVMARGRRSVRRPREGMRGGGLVGAFLLAAGSAAAQSPPAAPPLQTLGPALTSPYDISLCLCLQRDIASRQTALTERRNTYDHLAGEIHDARVAIARDRPHVDVNDADAIARFKQRLDELDAMTAEQDSVMLPAYQAAVTTYNQRVAQYTERCSGRALEAGPTAEVQSNLVCRLDP